MIFLKDLKKNNGKRIIKIVKIIVKSMKHIQMQKNLMILIKKISMYKI